MNLMIAAHLIPFPRVHLLLTTSQHTVRAVPVTPYFDGAGAQAAGV